MPEPTQPQPPRRSLSARLRRFALWMLCSGLALTVAAELVARFGLGIGDPPLYNLDPDLEYVLKPSRTYHELKHTFSVNRWCMRADDFAEHKAAPDELRILVLGDSIVHAGVKVDQSQTAVSVLQDALHKRLRRPVVVGNASAASWGPPNELAYLKKYGLLDADVVLLVLNSNDYDDVPGLEFLSTSTWPRETPPLALTELWGKYVPRFTEKLIGPVFTGKPPPHTTTHEQDIQLCMDSLRQMSALCTKGHAKFAILQYLKRPEIESNKPEPGYDMFLAVSLELGVPAFQVGPAFKASLAAGESPFINGDGVHANATGQRILAGVMEDAVNRLLQSAP